jgi:hypothetical protein
MKGLVAAVMVLQVCFSAFESREQAPALLFPYVLAAIHVTGPETLSNPADLPRLGNTYITASGSNPYSLDGFFCTGISVGHGGTIWGLQAFWRRMGIDGYVEQSAGAALGILPVKYLSVGLGAHYYNLSIDMDGLRVTQHQGDLRIGLRVMPLEWLCFAYEHDNLLAYRFASHQGGQRPHWSVGAGVMPVRGLEILWNFSSSAQGYVNTLALAADLLRYFTVSLGYSRETMSCAASLTVVYRNISASYGIRYHMHLGMTHSIGFSLALKSMEVRGIDFPGRPGRGTGKKIDINGCGVDELVGIPGLDGPMARRIGAYREMFGPLSRKALCQLGLSDIQVNDLMDHVYGLVTDQESSQKRDGGASARRDLFIKLLGLGLGPESALKIAEKSGAGRRAELGEMLERETGLSERTKKEVADLCAPWYR